jgi:hypothetical protein
MQGQTIPVVNERKVNTEASEISTLENLIKRKVQAIEKMKLERKNKKQMYDDSFLSSPIFQENKKKADEASTVKKKTVAEIAKQPAVAGLLKEVQDISLDIKREERLLSDYLLDYTGKMPTVTQLELFDGKFANIVKTAKLSRPKKPKKRRFR